MIKMLPKKWYLWWLFYVYIKLMRKRLSFTKGAGFYLPLGLIMWKPKEHIARQEMESGVTLISKLIDYRAFRDPDDMVEHSTWEIIGFPDTKPILECSFREFKEIYGEYLGKYRHGC